MLGLIHGAIKPPKEPNQLNTMNKEEIAAIQAEIAAAAQTELDKLNEQEQADKVQADLQEIRDSKQGDIHHG